MPSHHGRKRCPHRADLIKQQHTLIYIYIYYIYVYIYVCVYVYVYVYDIYIYKTPEQQKLLKNNRNLTTRNRDDSLGCLGYPWHYSISLWTKVKPNQPQHRHYVWVGPKIGTPKSSGSFQVLNKSMMETKFPSEPLGFWTGDRSCHGAPVPRLTWAWRLLSRKEHTKIMVSFRYHVTQK